MQYNNSNIPRIAMKCSAISVHHACTKNIVTLSFL